MRWSIRVVNVEPQREFETDNLVCRIRFTTVDAAAIGTPHEVPKTHIVVITLTDYVLMNWHIDGANSNRVTPDMRKVLLQLFEDTIADRLRHGPLSEGRIDPIFLGTGDVPDRCPYHLGNIR